MHQDKVHVHIKFVAYHTCTEQCPIVTGEEFINSSDEI